MQARGQTDSLGAGGLSSLSISVFGLGLVLWVSVADGGSLGFQFAVRVMLQDVVSDELDRVVGARFAHLRKSLHDRRCDRLFKVGLGGQVVHTDGTLLRHRGDFCRPAHILIRVAALWVQVVLLLGRDFDELFFDLLVLLLHINGLLLLGHFVLICFAHFN